MISYSKLAEKFEEKGFDSYTLLSLIPFPPLFDPPCWKLQHKSREELFEEFKNNYLMTHYQQQLEYYNTWIDYQKHK